MAEWQSYKDTVDKHTVVGDLRITRAVKSPQLNNERDLLAWLPDSYATGERRYPVLYMHDGMNLFDAHASYSGEWQVDETMQTLASEGYEAIIVGLANMGDGRRTEYNPYAEPNDPSTKNMGAEYMRFLVETIKPLVDADFRTLPDAKNTGITGSSMGGLISLYGFLTYQEVYGFCGAFSTAYWFGDNALIQTIANQANGTGKVYLDIGTKEGVVLDYFVEMMGIRGDDNDAEYVRGVRKLRDALLEKGYVSGENLMYIEEEGALHNEPAWTRRLPDALRFLLPR